jgi:hypothetical protein
MLGFGMGPRGGAEVEAVTYEILVRGELSDHLVADLGARRFEPRRGKTVIVIDIIDQSHLQGVLKRLQDHNIAIERVNPV